MAEPEKASTKKEAAVYCIPGDVIGPTTFCCGVHTHVYENQVVASCVGRLEKIKDEKLGKVFRFFLDKIFIKFSFSFPFFHFNHQMQYKDHSEHRSSFGHKHCPYCWSYRHLQSIILRRIILFNYYFFNILFLLYFLTSLLQLLFQWLLTIFGHYF